MLEQATCSPQRETVIRQGRDQEHGTAGEKLGEVAAQEELHQKEQPREPKEKRMQSACRDAWPSLGTELIDVPLAGMHASLHVQR